MNDHLNQKNSLLYSGLLFLALYFGILALFLFVDLINIIAYFFLPFPFIWFIYKVGVRNAFLGSIVAFALSVVLSSLIGNFSIIILTIMFASVGLIMGIFYKQNKGALAPVMAGMLTYLFYFIVFFIISVYVYEFNLTKFAEAYLNTVIEMRETTEDFLELPLDENQISLYKEYITYITSGFPALMITVAMVLTALHHMVQWRVLRRLKYEVDSLPPFRDWIFPKTILWYYLISMLLIFLGFMDPESSLFPIIFNLHYILEFVMFLQGLAVISYFSYHKRMSVLLPVLTVILAFLIPPIILMIVRLVGIFELGFGVRSRIKKKEK